jgi:cytidylate kinase
MPVITISRQFASGGSTIAELVGEILDWPVLDNDFIDRVAERAGLSKEEVEEHEERVPSLIERLADALAISSPEVFVATGESDARLGNEERMLRATQAVIDQLVEEDSNHVMVGRGAQAVLAGRPDALHVFIVAPRHVRIKAAMERLQMTREEAEDQLDKIDQGRRRYVKAHYDREWEDPVNYHLVLNTGIFSYEQCADLIVRAARTQDWS